MVAATKELIEKALAAQNVSELLAVMESAGVTLTQEQAGALFAERGRLQSIGAEALFEKANILNEKKGELSDTELENVAGGCGNFYSSVVQPIWYGLWKVRPAH